MRAATSQFVGGLEADALDVVGQTVRILLHDADGVIPVGLVDADGTGGSHTMTLEEDHDLADDPLIVPAFRDAFLAGSADASDFRQTFGLFLDDLEDLLAEGLDKSLGEVRTDALDET